MKKIKLLAFTFLLTIMMGNVYADETSVISCLTGEGKTCVLNEDIELSQSVDITNDIILDLNGHKITSSNTWSGSDYLIAVKYGSKLTINDSTGGGEISSDTVLVAIKLTIKGETYLNKDANLVVNGGKIQGQYYGISGNGNRNHANATINGGIITAKTVDDSIAIYFPQIGTLTINGGEIIACTGIEMRSGNLNVTSGLIKGTYKPIVTAANANGTTTKGAGIAVVQHTTLNNINVNISGGTIEGYTALFEKNLQNNSQADIDKVKLNISEGTFNAINTGSLAVYSENETDFITGGTFNTSVLDYVNNVYTQKYNNNMYKVIENKSVTLDNVTFESNIPFNHDYTLNVQEKSNSEKDNLNEKILEIFNDSNIKDTKLLALYEIEVLESNSEVVELLDGVFTISIMIDESLRNYDNYKVVYVNKQGEIAEEYQAHLIDGKIVFTTSHLSTYGIISINYEGETIQNGIITDVIIPNPQTGDNIFVSLIIMFVSALAIVSLILVNKKKFN